MSPEETMLALAEAAGGAMRSQEAATATELSYVRNMLAALRADDAPASVVERYEAMEASLAQRAAALTAEVRAADVVAAKLRADRRKTENENGEAASR